jgi:hypothetical protein
MYNDPSTPMQVEMFAASMRASYTDIGAFMEALAAKFEGALPAHTRVSRHSTLFSREHPVKEIVIMLGDNHYRIARERQGPLVAQRLHVVRGITLSSEDLAVERWIAEMAEALAQLAAQNALAHAALSRFLIQ